MKILIQKFGGTSVSTAERRSLVVDKIVKAKKAGYYPVVVVSAMGRKGQPYATDTLRSLVEEDFLDKNTLAADLLMGCGELISTVVMSSELFNKGIDAVPLMGGQAGIITDNNFNNASVLRVEKDRIVDLLKKDKIPVVAGFQGKSEDGYITTLGRGGSDVTAALLGAALEAESVEIYTDVDGIMTADPRIVENASLIKEISYNEVFQFADQGAKVIHPRAVEIAMTSNTKLVIKNTMTDCKGTTINNIGIKNSNNVITGITHMSNRTQIIVDAEENKGNKNYTNLLNSLAENSISIDLINVFPKEKIFTIDEKDFNEFSSIMKGLKIKFSYLKDCSKIAIIGSRMRGIPGVMAKILKALVERNIEVLQTADSHTTIWCLVSKEDTEKAIKSLHCEFKLDCI
ncbi:aspartate kinase [Clostridium botulinum]|uniref:aspartate kinase n=1 Tax=Clostridium botulinum TaxID=1491 RepID=UPI0001F84D98|nr:aspartate kinase [Clostridium botulinum]NFB16318.1 aspartate kinase [Clostridium botulinum]NFB67204.1 aspartate kinase [Clostridium botulinum]NFB96793.1 aspartate kinase [Clostridium botulinum]NFC48283.1 aspartate kinase [Clostridium botulinum]NFC57492.1 aspartate kinase [Clostridium botulinum]